MKQGYSITDYCIIRNQQVLHGTGLIFTGNENRPPAFLVEVYRHFKMNYPKFHKMDNLCKLGFLCAEILLGGKDFDKKYKGEDVGMVLYNAASSIDSDRNHQQSIRDREAYFPSPSVFVYTLANIVIGEICIRNRFFGESEFIISKAFNPAALYDCVKLWLDENIAECCIAGWLEFDGDRYEGILYLIEKTPDETGGIAIFGADKLEQFYLQGK